MIKAISKTFHNQLITSKNVNNVTEAPVNSKEIHAIVLPLMLTKSFLPWRPTVHVRKMNIIALIQPWANCRVFHVALHSIYFQIEYVIPHRNKLRPA